MKIIGIACLLFFSKGITGYGQPNNIADSLLKIGNYDSAVKEYDKVIISARNITSIDLGNAYLRKGTCFLRQEKPDLALPEYFKALKLFEAINNYERLYAATSSIASAYYKKRDTSNADKYWNYAYDYSIRSKDTISIISLLNDKAAILVERRLNRQANTMYHEALNKYGRFLDNDMLTTIYTNLAYSSENINKDSALFYYRKAETIAIRNNDSSKLSVIYNNLGYFHLRNNAVADASRWLERSSKFIKTAEDKLYTYYNLSEVYDSLRRYKESLIFLQKAYHINDSLFTLGASRIASELSEKYESDKKDEKINTQEIENKLKNRNLLLSLSGLALVAALAIISFISYQRKQKANKILQAQKEKIENLNKDLDASNQVKTKLFSVISHDLRSPISSLYAYLQLKSSSPDKKDQAIIGQTEQLLETLEDLLVWSKSQLHQFVPSIEKIYVCDLCNIVVGLIEKTVAEKQVQLINKIHPDLSIRSDVNMLTIVIRNLLSNAVAYSRPQTEIIIEAEQKSTNTIITISNETDGKNAALLTTPSEAIVTSNKSGLGITLVKEFITKLNGNFSYSVTQSKVTATITLPG